MEILVDSSGLRHVVAGDRVDAAWGEGCVDADAAWAPARLHLLLTSGRGGEIDEAVLGDPALAFLGGSVPHILLWGEDDFVLLDQSARPATMADLEKTLLLLHVPQNAQEELDSLDDHARAVLDAYVAGFNDCFHRDEERWLEAYPALAGYGLDKLDVTPVEVLARLNYFWVWGYVPGIKDVAKRINEGGQIRPAELDIPATDYEGASNEWFISAQYMADGRTVHATDPHIPFALPGTYGLTFRSVVGRFAGAGLIGSPGMLIGATTGDEGNVAWTVTASGPDGGDLFDVSVTEDGSSYFTSSGGMEAFSVESHTVSGKPFQLLHGRYGRVFLDHPNFEAMVALKSITEDPIRTFEWSLAMNEASNMTELRQALERPDGTSWGLQSLNLLATSNRPDAVSLGEASHYALLGRVPRRAGDDDRNRDYAGVLDSLDPLNEWTGGYYLVEEMPQAFDAPNGYAANCNVSPAVTDPRIGNDFPLSIIYSSENLTTIRQVSFESRIEELVNNGNVTEDALLAFATDSRAFHWEMIMDVLLQSYLLHGDPLDILQPPNEAGDDPEIPLGYEVMSILINMRNADGIHADDSYAGALMHAYTYFLAEAATAAGDEEVLELAGGGRPVSFEALSTKESARLAFQTFFDTVQWYIDVYPDPPTLKDLLFHPHFDGKGSFAFTGTTGGAGAFRTTGGGTGFDANGKMQTTGIGGSAFYQLSRIGVPGDVKVHLLKPYTSWDPNDELGTVMPLRFAGHEFTDVVIPPLEGDVVRRIER